MMEVCIGEFSNKSHKCQIKVEAIQSQMFYERKMWKIAWEKIIWEIEQRGNQLDCTLWYSNFYHLK